MLTFPSLLPILACLAPVLLLGTAGHRTVPDTSAPADLTRFDTARALVSFDPTPGCPTCGPDTPALDTSVQLVVPAVPPGQQAANSNFWIEFKMVGSPTPGECATDGTEPACINKECKYDISFKIEGHLPSSYQLLINTFPASDPKDPTNFIVPSAQHVGGWKNIHHFCGDHTDYEIEYQWYNYPGAGHIVDEDKDYTFGCKDC